MRHELCHHGIKGQRWGIRRFQKKNGELTPSGRKRYDDSSRLVGEKIGIKKSSYKAYAKSIAGGVLSGVTLDAAIRSRSYKNGKDAVKKMASTALFTTAMSLLITGARRTNAEMKQEYNR